MSYDEKRARSALATFQKRSGLRDYPWELASGVGTGTLRSFRNARNRAMSNSTYEKLAAGATALLGHEVTPAELIGDPRAARQARIECFVGGGDEVVPIPVDEAVDWVPAPPGMTNPEAIEVRGRSLLPIFQHGDLLFYERVATDPTPFRDELVVARTRSGKCVVRILQAGTRRGRFNLISVNPSFAPLENEEIEWVGPIEWINKRRRK
jgi:phage repressor protein C with HTH and peptisase S24 domain